MFHIFYLFKVEFPEDGFSEDDMFDLPTFKVTGTVTL